jgi:hypothetical protein
MDFQKDRPLWFAALGTVTGLLVWTLFFSETGDSKLCKKANADACLREADKAMRSQDVIAATQFFKKACDAGHAMGCNNYVAVASGNPQAGPVDLKYAHERLMFACRSGAPIACLTAANMLMSVSTRDGMQKEQAENMRAEARKAADEGCGRGMPQACVILGDLLVGIREGNIARRAFQKACDAKIQEGCVRRALIEKQWKEFICRDLGNKPCPKMEKI